jgi:hypothetical protein
MPNFGPKKGQIADQASARGYCYSRDLALAASTTASGTAAMLVAIWAVFAHIQARRS